MSSPEAVRERRKKAAEPKDETPESSSESSESEPESESEEVSKPKPKTTTLEERVKQEDSGISLLDILRSIVFVLLLSGAVSYFVTRESFTWGVERPKWSRVDSIKAWFEGPKTYTDEQLKAFDGTDPTKPILLAINGTIYDVSAGRRFYGPGGSYHFFAGADASRAFVTSCFDVDITPDMRGVENMFIPKDDPEIDSLYPKGELKKLKEQERRHAKKEVEKALGHWVGFFKGSKKYPEIGKVKREKGWEDKGEVRVLCGKAEQARPKRKTPGEK